MRAGTSVPGGLGYVVVGDAGPFERLGEGGVERWIVYPVVLWMVVFGAASAAVDRDPDAV